MSDASSSPESAPPPNTPPDNPRDKPPAVRLGPNHWDLYILVAGIATGLMLGPFVLGRISPGRYERLFKGGVDEQAAHDTFVQETTEVIKLTELKLRASGVTADAIPGQIQEVIDEREAENAQLMQAVQDARDKTHRTLAVISTCLLGLLVLVMIVEPLFDTIATEAVLARRRRLAHARYVVAALWIAVALARFEWL